ncbi:MAG: Eco57I restriction-modification methylase domain-containing protein [Lachnospiraceae bacterium]|nr:Eco57I restriction-modification methylase domain-containing protein [Lachnospiraceae bacterium]
MDIFNLLDITKLSSSEIITPQNVVDDMVNLLFESINKDLDNNPELELHKMKFLDPACKSARFLTTLRDRLMNHPRMIKELPNKSDRLTNILENQLFGIATTQTTWLISMRTLYGCLPERTNIICIDRYLQLMADKTTDYKALVKKGFRKEDMTFDVVISNPPYQQSNGGGNGSGAISIYDKFVMGAIEVSKRFVCVITPIRWYAGNKRLESLRQELTTSNKLLEFHDYPNTNELFGDTVYVMGGCCYYLYDKMYDGPCKIIRHRDSGQEVSTRYMLENDCDIFIRDTIAANIIAKIKNTKVQYMDTVISATVPFGIPTNEKGSIIQSKENNIIMFITGNEMKGGGVGYISEEDVTKNKHLIDKHKIFINTASDNMLNFPYSVLYKPFYGEPNTVCNGSYILIGNITSKEYCENIISYLCTKFVRTLVLQRKSDQRVYASTFKYVPMQDFTHPWTDQQLYEKYNLTQEEIDYIEKTIKPMN